MASSSSSSCINKFKPFSPLPSHYQIVAPSTALYLTCTSANSKQQSQRLEVTTSVAFNPSGNYEMSLFDDEDVESVRNKFVVFRYGKRSGVNYKPMNYDAPRVSPPEAPKVDRFEVVIDNDVVKQLDISPFQKATGLNDFPIPSSAELKEFLERTIGFTINFERESDHDSRELSEYPEIRLWFVRLDATYPWLPVTLDWRGGELARYAAMLVPHQMSMRMGVVFNPEALELFVMNKVFVVYSYLKQNKVPKPRLKTAHMAKMLGFGIGDELFDLIDQQRLAP
ncbi:unnamed protein product [Rhodiola kirilowii]